VPVVWHGVVPPDDEEGVVDRLGTTTRGVKVIKGANGLGVRATDGGLRPPLPSSVAPRGIPARATDDPPMPPGDEADATDPAKELPPVEAQAPDAVPVMPPPSNTDDVDVPALDIPEPEDVPVIELPPVPKDVCGIEPPAPEHVVAIPFVGAVGDTPDVIGLTPGDASSVAPRGVFVGVTGEPAPMPSGDVICSGTVSGEACAKAEPQPKRTAAVVANTKRVIIG
jgi:hypothetical protein